MSIARDNRDELAARIDQALERLHVGKRAPLNIDVVGNSVVITVTDADTRATEFKAAMDLVNDRYAECFRTLAK